jgi:copper chaperone
MVDVSNAALYNPYLAQECTRFPGLDRADTMGSETITLKVAMACGGCSAAVERVLGKMKEVTSVDCSLDDQRVVVVTDGTIGKDKVLAAVAKTGKSCELV